MSLMKKACNVVYKREALQLCWNRWNIFCAKIQRRPTSESRWAVRRNSEIHSSFKSTVSEWFTPTSHLWLVSQLPRNKRKKPTRSQHTEETNESQWRETTPHLLVVASNWSGISLGNCTFLSCWVCLDSETEEDYSASSRHPRLCKKKKKVHQTVTWAILAPDQRNAMEGGRI